MTSSEAPVGTLTVRLIKSFPHRNIRHVVYQQVNLSQTAQQFLQTVHSGQIKLLKAWLYSSCYKGESLINIHVFILVISVPFVKFEARDKWSAHKNLSFAIKWLEH